MVQSPNKSVEQILEEIENFELKEEITIIYPPTLDWYFLFQRPQQLLTAFSKFKKVTAIFMNPETLRKQPKPIMKLNDNLFLVRTGINYSPIVKGKKVLIYTYPNHWNFSSNMDYTIFDAVDNPTDEFSHWKPGIEKSQEVADLISCTAQVMYDEHVQTGKPTILNPNGADFEHFRKAHYPLPRPGDFPKIAGEPIIGFYGAMASWVDYDLIKKIASKYKVVLVGANQHYNTKLDHPNIKVLPHKDYKHLPYYLSQFDACLVPFKLSEMIKGCDPIKYYEYLSAGKPVLTTDLIELRKYSDVHYVIDHDNCLEQVEKALKEDDIGRQKARMEVAKANSWNARALEILKSLNDIL